MYFLYGTRKQSCRFYLPRNSTLFAPEVFVPLNRYHQRCILTFQFNTTNTLYTENTWSSTNLHKVKEKVGQSNKTKIDQKGSPTNKGILLFLKEKKTEHLCCNIISHLCLFVFPSLPLCLSP